MTLTEIFEERRGLATDIVGHMQYLHDVIIERDAQVVVELGVRAGNSTAAFLAAVEQTGGHLYSVDIIWPPVPDEFTLSNHWTLYTGNDLDLAELIPDGIDVLFIDTSHLYAQTLAELEVYVPKVKPGGLVLLHDTELECPDGGVDEPPFPVASALNDWSEQTGIGWTNRPGSYGLGVVEVPHGG